MNIKHILRVKKCSDIMENEKLDSSKGKVFREKYLIPFLNSFPSSEKGAIDFGGVVDDVTEEFLWDAFSSFDGLTANRIRRFSFVNTYHDTVLKIISAMTEDSAEKSVTRTIKKERKMLNFQRLAGTRKLRSYNLAEHSYFVGLMFQELADHFGIEYTTETLRVIFRHDFMEVFTTDLPSQVKNLNEATKMAWDTIEAQALGSHFCKGVNNLFSDEEMKARLTPEQFCLLKWCDTLELVLFCLEEKAMGNGGRDIQAVLENCNRIFSSDYYSESYDWNKELLRLIKTFVEDESV